MSSAARSANPDRQNRLILIGAIGLAVLAAILVFVSLSNFGGGSSNGTSVLGGTSSVVVTTQDIKAGTKITDGMLVAKPLPPDAIIPGALSDLSGLVGLTARYPLAKGDQVTPTKLGQTEKNPAFSNVIPDGKRAVSVDVVEKTSVGGLIVAGDHVDVIVIGKAKSTDTTGSGQDQPAAFTLLQDVEVLSVAQTSQAPVARIDKNGNPITTDTASGSISAPPSDTSANAKAKTVTLAVSPDDAAKLALAGQSYSVYLSLRGSGDDSQINNPTDLQQLPDVH
jgi:pilus assembly protein CpaB